MDKKQDFWSWWCYRKWIHFSLCITGLVTVAILFWWNEWSAPIKVLAAIGALVPVHVVEEWVFPGGFHYQYNLFAYHSEQLDRYPLSRLVDTIVNLIATIFYVLLALWYVLTDGVVPASVILMAIGFCIFELIIHTYFGIAAWLRFRKDGKTTIYGPGSITAYLGFGVLGAILCYSLADYTITGNDYLWGAAELIAFFIGIFIPQEVFKSHAPRFRFPSAGYYERFLNK